MYFLTCLILLTSIKFPNVCSFREPLPLQVTKSVAIASDYITRASSEAYFQEEPIDFFDEQKANEEIINFINKLKSIHNAPANKRSKRNNEVGVLYNSVQGIYVFDGMDAAYLINVQFPIDILIFNNGIENEWFAAVLEAEGPDNKYANYLVLHKFSNSTFTDKFRMSINNGVTLEYFIYNQEVYLIVAEYYYNSPTKRIGDGCNVYLLTSEVKLDKIQTLNAYHPSSVTLWEDMNDIFLIITEESGVYQNEITYEVEVPIYRWVGRHFDIVHFIPTSNAKQAAAFKIENNQFLAIANHKNDNDETEIFSEIFKYDIHLDRFVSYQKILSSAAVDVVFFTLIHDNVKESFLAIANLYVFDENGLKYDTYSHVYKFIDGFFIPFQTVKFNGLLRWHPIQGINNEFVLIAVCKYSQNILYQYDGWQFIEIKNRLPADIFNKNMKSLRTVNKENELIIVAANRNDNNQFMYFPKFSFKNSPDYYNEIINWCEETISELDKEIKYTLNDNKKKRQLNLDDKIFDLESLRLEISKINEEVFNIEQMINNSMKLDEENIFIGSITADVLNLFCDTDPCDFDNVNVDNLNGMNMIEFFKEAISIKNNSIGSLLFDKLIIEEINHSFHINNNRLIDIISVTDELSLDQIIINGNIFFENNLQVDGFIGDVRFSEDVILLKNGDQLLNGTLNTSSLVTDTLNVEMKQPTKLKLKIHIPENIPKLEVEDLIIRKMINNVDLKKLKESSLKKIGDQIIVGSYSFKELETNDFNTTNYINGENIPEDLILISNGSFNIDVPVEFIQDVIVNEFIVRDRINEITVDKGSLNILLKNVTEIQHITGQKLFESVNLTSPLKLQGHIKSTILDQMNPVKMIDDELIIGGTVTIKGTATIEHSSSINDIKDISNVHSVQRLRKFGLKLNATVIDIPITFTDFIDCRNIITASINKIDPFTWIVTGGKVSHYIKGTKTFTKDIHINNGISVFNLNDINLQELDKNVLKISGDQKVSGSIKFQNMTVNRIQSKNIKLRNIPFERIINQKSNNILINGDTYIDNLLFSKETQLTGKLSGYKIEELYQDTIIKNDSFHNIIGKKIFGDNLKVFNLNISQNINAIKINDILSKLDLESNRYVLNEDMNFDSIYADHLFYSGTLNGISKNDFGNVWLLQDSDQIIKGNQHFKSINIKQNGRVSGKLTDSIDIDNIIRNCIYLNKEEFIGDITFSNGVISEGDIHLLGLYSGINLSEDIIFENSSSKILHRNKIFGNDIYINNNLIVKGLISGVNYTDLHKFVFPEDGEIPPTLILNGSAIFQENPDILFLNDIDYNHLLNNVWFADINVELTGEIEFQNLILENDIFLDKNINGYNLTWLQDNYFSKTKNQTSKGLIRFADNLHIDKNLNAVEATVGGLISGIELRKFSNDILLQGFDQNISFRMRFDEIEVTENMIFNNFINGYNLKEDLMKYNVPINIVKGKKIITNVDTAEMILPNGCKIQGIDIKEWINQTVSLNKEIIVNGSKTFKSAVFHKNIELLGFLNNILFNEDHVMLNNTRQMIRGKILFTLNDGNNKSIYFKKLKIDGLLNNIDVTELLQNQAYVSEDLIFSSPKHFLKSLTAKNIIPKKMLFGLNIQEVFEYFYDEPDFDYLAGEYVKLNEAAGKTVAILKDHAHFLSYFKEVQTMKGTFDFVIPMNINSDQHLVTVQPENTNSFIYFFRWDENMRNFVIDKDVRHLMSDTNTLFASNVQFGDTELLYAETKRPENVEYEFGGNFATIGKLFQFLDNRSLVIANEIPTNYTQYIEGIKLPLSNKNCLLILSKFNNSDLYCETRDENINLDLYQQIQTRNGIDVRKLYINNELYLIIVNSGYTDRDASVDIWCYSEVRKVFELHQIINVACPNSISTITYKNIHYLAIASGYNQNAVHPGLIDIRRFDTSLKIFVSWKDVRLNAPIDIQFAVLPSEELLLYVLTDNPTEPLVIYLYNGMAGFKLKTTASTIPRGTKINHITLSNSKHFIIINNNSQVRILQAYFKGRN